MENFNELNETSKHVEMESGENFITGVWSERVLVITEDYEIKGYVFLPKTGRKNRLLSDILNGKKRFVAIKDCEVTHRNSPSRKIETQDFYSIKSGFNNNVKTCF
jgi:hypothetical protein